MKWAFVTMLVLNIGYFAWEFNSRLPISREQSKNLESLSPSQELRLLSELGRKPELRRVIQKIPGREALSEPRSAAANAEIPRALSSTSSGELSTSDSGYGNNPTPASAQAKEDLPANQDACFSLGPLPTQQLAIEVQDWLNGANARTKQRIEEQTVATKYWIFLDHLGSPAAAREKLAALEQKGVEDFLLTREQDGSNVISLGLYSTRASLDIRLADLRKNGFHPQVQPRHKVQTRYWIDILGRINSSVLARIRERFSMRIPIEHTACVPPLSEGEKTP